MREPRLASHAKVGPPKAAVGDWLKSACGPSEGPEGSAAQRRPRARARGGGAPRAV